MDVKDANLKFTSTLQDRSLTTYLVLHHAAWKTCTVQDVHNAHINNGWAGIGYHYFVRKNGEIWRGRPEGTVGAHAIGVNAKSIGICAEGDYSTETMPTVQLNSIISLCRDIINRYPNICLVRHCEVSATDCPGKNYPFNEIVNASYAQEVENMTTDEVRNIAQEVYDTNHPTYEKIENVPTWGQDAVMWAQSTGLLKGDGKGLDITTDELSTLVFLKRFYDTLNK